MFGSVIISTLFKSRLLKFILGFFIDIVPSLPPPNLISPFNKGLLGSEKLPKLY
jgi:hypothetical protein